MHEQPCPGSRLPKSLGCAPSRLCLLQPAHLGKHAGRASVRKSAARAATGAGGGALLPDHPAVLLESDAAVLDLHVDGHRVAFNRAFDVRLSNVTLMLHSSLALPCTSPKPADPSCCRDGQALDLPTKRWTPDLYHHLRQCGDGRSGCYCPLTKFGLWCNQRAVLATISAHSLEQMPMLITSAVGTLGPMSAVIGRTLRGRDPVRSATGMLKTWFNTAGWPYTMAKSDHRNFADKILREKDEALGAMLRAGEVPLRDGELQSERYRGPSAYPDQTPKAV